jgi:lipopolysaccharide/colanic/teichoic acid biosynthesis glycosyltransferase
MVGRDGRGRLSIGPQFARQPQPPPRHYFVSVAERAGRLDRRLSHRERRPRAFRNKNYFAATETTMVTAAAELSLPVHPGSGFVDDAVSTDEFRGQCPRCGRLEPAPEVRWCPIKRLPRLSLLKQLLEAGKPFIRPEGNLSPWYRAAKRLADVLGALLLLLLLSPVMLAIVTILMVTTRGKPFFVQRRVGYLGRSFWIIKFTTMRSDAEQMKHQVRNQRSGPIFKNRQDPRITRLGRWLRKTSLDETPQLLNVLLGQMSLVGPRPLVILEIVQMKAWQRRRLAVVPGLTCLWQVSGRSEVAFENWMRMDLWYVQHQSLWNDFKLLLRTPISVLSGRGAY